MAYKGQLIVRSNADEGVALIDALKARAEQEGLTIYDMGIEVIRLGMEAMDKDIRVTPRAPVKVVKAVRAKNAPEETIPTALHAATQEVLDVYKESRDLRKAVSSITEFIREATPGEMKR